MRHGNQIGLAMAIVLIAGNSFAEVPQAFAKQARTFAPPSCADGNETVDKPEVSALMMISEGQLPDVRTLKVATAAERRCVESLREIGRRAIDQKRLSEGTYQFLVAVRMAPALAGATYAELATSLDRAAYPKHAMAAFLKAWKAFDTVYARPGVRLTSDAVLSMADIRDAIQRLGGHVPKAVSEPGRLAVSETTRRLKERYFRSFPAQ